MHLNKLYKNDKMSNKLQKYTPIESICDKTFTENINKTLFVFYTRPSKYWKYGKFPDGWKSIGSGRTYPFPVDLKKIPKYTNEEQFSGPSENQLEMVKFLEYEFQKLKEEKAIDCFEIKETYM